MYWEVQLKMRESVKIASFVIAFFSFFLVAECQPSEDTAGYDPTTVKKTIASGCSQNPADPSDDSEYVRCLLVEYMDSRVQDIACDQRVYSADGLCPSDQQRYQTDFYNKGQFRSELNQRNQEAVYTLAFLYQESRSAYYLNSNLLNRVLFGLDYLRRAQGDTGAISEVGWQGVDYNDVDCDGEKNERTVKENRCKNDPPYGSGMSVSGFTYYAAAMAINLLAKDPNFLDRVDDLIVIGGDGVADDLRNQAYSYLITKAAYYLANGGRGHAPNQDVFGLLALHALNKAYDQLGYTVPESDLDALMDDLDRGMLNDLRDEIFYGSPAEAVSGNGFNRWFTSQALLLEKGYKATNVDETDSHSAGYDGNYSWVTLRALVLLGDWDSTFRSAGFIEKFVNWFQYFFYVDLNKAKGGYQVTAIARRKWQDGDLKLPVAGLLQGQPAMKTIFNATLEHFVADPSHYFVYDEDSLFKGFYVIGDFLQHWVAPSKSDYVLPLNQNPVNFSQYRDTQADQAGNNIVLLEITDTGDTAYDVRYRVNDWWNGAKEYYFGSTTAKVTINDPVQTPCNLYQTPPFYCYKNDDPKDDILEYVVSCNGCTTQGSNLTLYVDVTEPEPTGIDVDYPVNDGSGNYFDDDDDNDQMPDTWEAQYGLDPLNAGDASIDSDGDGFTNLQEYQANTSPIDPAKFPSACNIPASGDWVVTENCTITGSSAASANVLVKAGVVLTISSQGSLDLNFADYALRVEDGGGVFIKDGGKLD